MIALIVLAIVFGIICWVIKSRMDDVDNDYWTYHANAVWKYSLCISNSLNHHICIFIIWPCHFYNRQRSSKSAPNNSRLQHHETLLVWVRLRASDVYAPYMPHHITGTSSNYPLLASFSIHVTTLNTASSSKSSSSENGLSGRSISSRWGSGNFLYLSPWKHPAPFRQLSVHRMDACCYRWRVRNPIFEECRVCGNKNHSVETVRGTYRSLCEDDSVTCKSCGLKGVIHTNEGYAFVLSLADWRGNERMTTSPLKVEDSRARFEAWIRDEMLFGDEELEW